MDNKELGNTAVCMEGYAWKGRKEIDTPTARSNLSLLVKKNTRKEEKRKGTKGIDVEGSR